MLNTLEKIQLFVMSLEKFSKASYFIKENRMYMNCMSSQFDNRLQRYWQLLLGLGDITKIIV